MSYVDVRTYTLEIIVLDNCHASNWQCPRYSIYDHALLCATIDYRIKGLETVKITIQDSSAFHDSVNYERS